MTPGGQVLVTRPEPGLSETMAALRRLGFTPVAAPLLRVSALQPALSTSLADRIQAILLTSGQAADPLARLAAGRPSLLARPVLAVGDGTARRAGAAGFTRTRSASGDAMQLAALAASSLRPEQGPLLLACGRGQGAALLQSLRGGGFRVIRRCVYDATPARSLPAAAVAALETGPLHAALFFSAETAAAFARLLPDRLRGRLGQVRALTISTRAADVIRPLGWRSVETAPSPTAASLLALLGAPGDRASEAITQRPPAERSGPG